jgi:phenylacetate-CoA ligase
MRNAAVIAEAQTEALRILCRELVPANSFYTPKIQAAGFDVDRLTLETFTELMPFTTRDEWVRDQLDHPPYGTNLTYPLDRYVRFCRTSGSTGHPMTWLDTPESWDAQLDCWARVYEVAGVTQPHRIFFAFSFGPFLGFWTAYDAATKLGHLPIPGGGMSSAARLQLMIDTQAEVLCCTPTYALRLAQVAEQEGIRLDNTAVAIIIVAGEPGGSIAPTRSRISQTWNGARVFDHHGMTEVGPVSYECPTEPGVLHVMEDTYFPEVLDDELILTTLMRSGSPLLRYRTGDIVQAELRSPCACGSHELSLIGGIRGRTDDMVVIRGVNVFPSAIENIVRATNGVNEYEVYITTKHEMVELMIRIEGDEKARSGLSAALENRLTLRIPVEIAPTGSLPRYEMKAKRWITK